MVNNTKNGSGSPGEAPGIADYQRRWRRVGVLCLGAAALMAWQSASMSWPGWRFAVLWWGGLILLLFVALYTVALDLRYTALLRKLEERRIFLETFGDPEFRRQVRALANPEKHTHSTSAETPPGPRESGESAD